MKKIQIAGLIGSLALISLNAHANWLCNIANQNGHQWTVAAPDENSAEAMAQRVCSSNNIKPTECIPDCFDNGIKAGRWHCAVTNTMGEHWSYFAPTKKEAQALSQHGCSIASVTPVSCKPICIPE